MGRDMSVEAKGFSAARIKAAVLGVTGVTGVQGSPMNHKKPSQPLRCYALGGLAADEIPGTHGDLRSFPD